VNSIFHGRRATPKDPGKMCVANVILALSLLLFGAMAWAGDAARVVFVAGGVWAAERPLRTGDFVREGEPLRTGADGYLYLETADKGFFILRPGSVGEITTYQIDAADPSKTRIKLELRSGVARHISGQAVKSARQHFRFNTPVAAVGVRGTDFTVYANADTTRISVLSGGVVVSPFTDGCTVAAFGPCEGASSRELFANKVGQVLQIMRGQTPVFLQGVDASPDNVVPPRPDEPSTKTSLKAVTPGSAISNNGILNGGASLDPIKTSLITEIASTLPPAPPQLIWGRWQPLLDQSIQLQVNTQAADYELIATNSYFAIMRHKSVNWQAPVQSSLGFSLQSAQATVFNEKTRQVSLAGVENGQLQLNFAQSTFFTQFDLTTNQGERIALQNTGQISSDGRLYGGLQILRPNNMDVRGTLSGDNLSAAYLFQSRLDSKRVASGLTTWGR